MYELFPRPDYQTTGIKISDLLGVPGIADLTESRRLPLCAALLTVINIINVSSAASIIGGVELSKTIEEERPNSSYFLFQKS